MSARAITIDFSKAADVRLHKSGNIIHRGASNDLRPRDSTGKLLTEKQIRARARRRADKARRNGKGQILTPEEMAHMYKPIEEWDNDELAHGRPRNRSGNFSGAKPSWITREVHEQAMERFTENVKGNMREKGLDAMKTIAWVLNNEDTDERGKPLVPASVKLQASSFLLEHIVGKPKQRVETDISVKLQAVLGAVMVNPNQALAPGSQGGMSLESDSDEPAYSLAHLPGQTIPIGLQKQPGDDEDPLDVDSWDEEDNGG